MNFLLISTLVIASITIFPAITYGSTTTEIEEQPHALPIVIAQADQHTAGEIWQENEREVLIRSERGAKNNAAGGAGATAATGSGKREKNKRININKNKNSGEKIESKEKIERPERPAKNERPTKVEKPLKSEKREKIPKKSPCKYDKGQWSECNQETNIRSRVLTLKKGDEGCVPTRTIQRKCKKSCRYNRGDWSECVNGSMTRKDNIRPGCDASCKPTREITKNCNKDKKNKNKKEKNARKTHQ